MGPFAIYLQECAIRAQYTMPGTLERTGVDGSEIDVL